MENYNTPLYMTKRDFLYRISSSENVNNLWEEVLKFRRKNGIKLCLKDQEKKDFFFSLTEELKKKVVEVDDLSKNNFFEDLSENEKIDIIRLAQEDEAFYSSVIEGAHTTKKRTKELVEKGLEPQNKDEKMVLNNYHALSYIMENIHKNITEELIVEIFKIVTKGTLEEEEFGYRKNQNFVRNLEVVVYEPPKFEDVSKMMKSLVAFIGDDTDERVHPIVKAFIIHFYFVYIHPFNDGNGRTARALTYMYLLKNGYHFFKFFSISSLLKEFRGNYYKAIKNVEDYDSDLTYFIDFYLDMTVKSIKKVSSDFKNQYLLKVIKGKILDRGLELNKRQEKTLEKIIKIGKKNIDIIFYMSQNKVVQETARKDLSELVEMEILLVSKLSKKNVYNLNERF